MPTNFPTSLDAITNPTSLNYLDDTGVVHADLHSNVNDAIEAMQDKIGIDNSLDATSLDYLLKNTASVNP